MTSDKNGKGIVRAAYKLNRVILIRGESRNTAGSNTGAEDGESADSADITEMKEAI